MAIAEDDPDAAARTDALRAGLEAGGWTAGRNVILDFRWAVGDIERTRRLAAELLDLRPDVVVTNGSPATHEVLKLTKTIPVIFTLVADPVGAGFVSGFTRPGGNATGYVNFEATLVTKWVELLLEIDRSLERALMIFNPDTAPGGGSFFLDPFVAAAATWQITTQPARVRTDADIDAAIGAFAAGGRGAVVVTPDVFAVAHRGTILAAVARAGLPAIYPYRYFTVDGGLMSYGIDTTDTFQQTGTYVARILSGANPGDLPVQAPSKYEFVINTKTAGTLGIAVPSTLLLRADAVIE
jgi:putative ABC transport system substrate-binding protein